MNDEVLSEKGALFLGGDTGECRISNVECRMSKENDERGNNKRRPDHYYPKSLLYIREVFIQVAAGQFY